MMTSSPQGDISLGEVIQSWRTSHGWTVTEFARRAGLSKGYISQVEHSKILQPKLEQLARIASALGITEWDLINRRLPDQSASPVRSHVLSEETMASTYLRPTDNQSARQYRHVLEDVLQRLRELERIVENLLQLESSTDEHQ